MQTEGGLWEQAIALLSDDERSALQELEQTERSQQPCNEAAMVNDVTALCRQKLSARERRTWTVKFGKIEIDVREKLIKIVGWLDKFKAIGDYAVNADPAHAAAPWAVFRFVLQVR
jgi:hypothetical protein